MTPAALPAEVLADLEARGLAAPVREAAARHHVTAEEVCGLGRTASVARARFEAWAAIRAVGLSYPEIGRLFARDHATVWNGVRRAGGAPPKRDRRQKRRAA